MSRVSAALWDSLIAVQIYGANTGVGKTVLSTLLGAHFIKRKGKARWNVNYIKPVSTGPSSEADDKYIHRHTGLPVYTIFQFRQPVSPHIAARDSQHIPSNEHLLHRLYDRLRKAACDTSTIQETANVAIVETAGGVLSPGPTGTLQADLFRPMRLPVILVGDHRLGGIGSTISAAESLIMRGYDIDAVVCFDDRSLYENAAYLSNYFGKLGIPVFTLPWIPDLENITAEEEADRMTAYYEVNSRGHYLCQIAGRMIDMHSKRLNTTRSLATRTKDTIWHPFTQHKHVEHADEIHVFDSAYGDYFQVKHTMRSLQDVEHKEDVPILHPAFDGSASWWTQGLGHGNPKLALQAAYAAGRFGHVMFAGATHEPAIILAERILEGLDNPRLKKVFYSDDGSTASEVGMKMGLRASCKRYGWDGAIEDIGILGLKGSYHGDTIGAMDASEPCVFNQKVDWYRGRGYWFDYPTFKMRKGRWIVEPPKGMEEAFGPTEQFDDMDSIFDLNTRVQSPRYEAYIERTLNMLVKEQGKKFGALVMEPVVLGAGGMLFVDPLFQHSLVRVVRRYNFATILHVAPPDTDEPSWSGLPVLFDEVFTGLYRLGRFSSASFLDVHPDISIHAKLLTGGLLPLSVTTASKSIFDSFWGDDKADALLHGHSYTAHPIGCHVANVSLQIMDELNKSDGAWRGYKKNWRHDTEQPPGRWSGGGGNEHMWSVWSRDFVRQLSKHERVDYVNVLGSVLAVSLVDKSGSSGYSSFAAIGLRDALFNKKSKTQVQIHSRVLGNVLYIMASMVSKPEHLADVEAALLEKLSMISW